MADPTWAGQPMSRPALPYCSFPGSPHLCPPSRLHGDASFGSVILNIFSPQPPTREPPLLSSKLSGTFISHPLRPSTSPRLALSLITHHVTSPRVPASLTITSAQRSEPRPRGDGRFLSPHVALSSQRAFMAFRGHAVRPRPFALTVPLSGTLFLSLLCLQLTCNLFTHAFPWPTKIPIPFLRVSFSLQ